MICNNHNGNESCCYDGEQDTNDHCYWHYWHYTQQHTKQKEEIINLRIPESTPAGGNQAGKGQESISHLAGAT